MDKLLKYNCKRFENNAWHWLGTVYAPDETIALQVARQRFGRVDSVYTDILNSLPDREERIDRVIDLTGDGERVH